MKKRYSKQIGFINSVAVAAAVILCAYQTKALVDNPNDPIYKHIDKTVAPGENFFLYANGTWLKENPIPAAYSSWGIGNIVSEEIRDRLKKINEDALKANAPKGSTTQKLGDFYYTGLDSTGIEKTGIAPLQEQLALIDQAQTAQDILNAAAILTTTGTRNILGMRVGQDDKNSEKMMVQFGQTG